MLLLFICDKSETDLVENYPNALKWIKSFETKTNKTGRLLPEVFKNRKPHWYTLKPEKPANIFISINPYKKLFFSYSSSSIHLNQRLVAIRVQEENVEIVAALLNSIVSLLGVELNGVSRNLGALDLNADFFKTKMKMFDPNLLTEDDRTRILSKFRPLSLRKIENYDKEFQKVDRIEFDKAILQAYRFNIEILPKLYDLMIKTVTNRVEMKNK